MIALNGNPINATIFPDKTSQVWKIPKGEFARLGSSIEWKFDYEGEFLHVAQLVELLHASDQTVTLHLPYLPYGRQDKPVSNSATFALHTFARLLGALPIETLVLYDPHSNVLRDLLVGRDVRVRMYQSEAKEAFSATMADLWCYPDSGAAAKYGRLFSADPSVSASKARDQGTGEITGLSLSDPSRVAGKRVMIVDDICDGGATFIALAKALFEHRATDVFLFVSHGLFSKGLKPLFDSGISRIFTPEGEQIL